MGLVWYHPNGIANILSISKIANHFRIIYDNWGSNEFEEHESAGIIRSFVEYPRGLFYMDINNYQVYYALMTKVADKETN